jgi:hypothetical protein
MRLRRFDPVLLRFYIVGIESHVGEHRQARPADEDDPAPCDGVRDPVLNGRTQHQEAIGGDCGLPPTKLQLSVPLRSKEMLAARASGSPP